MRYLTLLFGCIFGFSALAQERPAAAPLYGGMHAGMPLYWGDLRSVGEEFNPGYGGGLFAGYRFGRWLAAELNADYLQGKLGPAPWQLDDRIDDRGIIRYAQGTYALRDIHSKTRLFRAGLRLPVRPLSLLGSRGRLQVELAPQFFLNRFSAAIHDAESGEKLIDGATPRAWSYSGGGDVAFSYRTGKRTDIFLRSAVNWLYDDRFEGVATQPAWRENFSLYTSVGVRFELGKSRRPKRESEPSLIPVEEPREPEEPPVDTAVRKDELPEQFAEQETTPDQTEQSMTIPDEWIAPIYFRFDHAIIDQKRYAEHLRHIRSLALAYNELPIVIEGWADTTGPEAYNRGLSQRRAKALADYLVDHGVDAARITVVGNGEDHQGGAPYEGRRVELRFVVQPDPEREPENRND